MQYRVDEQAIKNWQIWLNKTYPPANWMPIDGFNTMTGLDYTISGTPIFNGNRGYPLKGFVNTATGEVKVFDARRFYSIS